MSDCKTCGKKLDMALLVFNDNDSFIDDRVPTTREVFVCIKCERYYDEYYNQFSED